MKIDFNESLSMTKTETGGERGDHVTSGIIGLIFKLL